MKNKKQVAPSLEDLGYAQVESSYLFGFTNVSGKLLALTSLASLGGGATGIAQGLGFMGPVAGMSASLMTGLAIAGVSVATGLVGYWLGNFDDKRIKAHNARAYDFNRHARGQVYDRVERGLITALSKIEYDPREKHLPPDALGYAVLLTDDKLSALPAHIQLDIYRTQLDLELYKHKRLVSAGTLEGQDFETRTMSAETTMAEKATAYKLCRDRVRARLKDGSLIATPVGQSGTSEHDSGINLSGDAAVDLADVAGDLARLSGRGGGGLSGGGGFKGFGGGRSGGGGAGASWDDVVPAAGTPSAPGQAFFSAGMVGSSPQGSAGMEFPSSLGSGGSDSGGGLGSGLGSLDVDSDAAGPLLIIAGIAAVVAAATVAGFSVWKNFISRAEKPALEGVHIPMLAKSLATAEKDIRRMYAPS